MSIEAMRQALDALEHEANIGNDNAYQRERDALRTAIAEAEKQAPVAWLGLEPSDMPDGDDPMYDHDFFLKGMAWADAILRKKNTTPPAAQRQWVGLTDDEIKEIIGPWGDTPIKGYTRKLFDQIEAKLKEKNT
jgi:hypothetical protein